MTDKKIRITYILFDFISSALAWFLFFYYRKYIIETSKFGLEVPIEINDKNLLMGVFLIPVFWISIYYLTGQYNQVLIRSRLREIVQLFVIAIFGCLFIFFVLLLDDTVRDYRDYYKSFLILFSLHFGIVSFVRYCYSTSIKRKIQTGKISFNTLLIGNNIPSYDIFKDLTKRRKSEGYRFVGYLQAENDPEKSFFNGELTKLGSMNDLEKIVNDHAITEVIVSIQTKEHYLLEDILNTLGDKNINIKIVPDMYDIVSGNVKMNHVLGPALIHINPQVMPSWQQSVKRILDVGFSLFVLLVFSPLYLIIAVLVKFSSKGPVFYRQERIGINGNPFKIIKFRSMYIDAEAQGPRLSTGDNDNRITPVGRFLRKSRLDEIPQFYNVLIGQMSLVGPRPERQFFIDQIVKIAPQYKHLHKVKPGITSWGQVKYGYAENVNEMVQRLKFDLIYVENMSLALDVKILLYTMLIMLQGRGQ